MNKLIRITEASGYLGLSPTTLRRWTREGLSPVFRSPGGRFFWTRELLDEIKNGMLDHVHAKQADVANVVSK